MITVYIVLLVLLNYFGFKKLDKITNSNLFYILCINILSFSLYMFLYMYNDPGVSLINTISILLVLYFYMKEKCSIIKTTLFLLNIYVLFKILI